MEYHYTSSWTGRAEREALVDKFFLEFNKMVDEVLTYCQDVISEISHTDKEMLYEYCYRLVKFNKWKQYLNDNKNTLFFHYCEGHPKNDKYCWIIDNEDLEILINDISIVKSSLMGYDTDLWIPIGRTENFSELFIPILDRVYYHHNSKNN